MLLRLFGIEFDSSFRFRVDFAGVGTVRCLGVALLPAEGANSWGIGSLGRMVAAGYRGFSRRLRLA